MYCSNCGKEVGEGKFCQECGAPVSNIAVSSGDFPAQAKPRKVKKPIFKRWWFWLLIILLAFILLIALSPSEEGEKSVQTTTVSNEVVTEITSVKESTKATTKATNNKDKKASSKNESKPNNEYVYEGKNFNITYEGVKTDNELWGMSGASSNLFGIIVTIENLSDKTMTYTLEDIYVDDTYAGVSGVLNTSTPVTIAPGKKYHGYFSGTYGAPGDIKNASELEFKAVGSDENLNKIEESPIIKVSIR